MRIPNDDQCRAMVQEALEMESDLTEWEYNFISGNTTRRSFSDKQKLVFQRLAEKYEFDTFQP